MSTQEVVIYQGHALDVLRTLPTASVQVCATSPPYLGLRSYQTEPVVWDGDPLCDHLWGAALPGVKQRWGTNESLSAKQTSNLGSAQRTGGETSCGAFCQKCEAWRGELGAEPHSELFIQHLVSVFREVKRVLRDDGCLWVNLDDSYTSSAGEGAHPSKMGRRVDHPGDAPHRVHPEIPAKNLLMIPARFALAMQADGWIIRADTIWHKNGMPESVQDRPSRDHEHVYLFSKKPRYFYDSLAVRVPYAEATKKEMDQAYTGKALKDYDGNGVQDPGDVKRRTIESLSRYEGGNLRSVWQIRPQSFVPEREGLMGTHFATFPCELVRRIILLSTPEVGSCPACGKPYQRVTEKEGKTQGVKRVSRGGFGDPQNEKTGSFWIPPRITDTSWQPGCKCNAGPPVPSVVLDPFCGAGTTPATAMDLGRSAIGIELLPASARLATDRCRAHEGLLTGIGVVKEKTVAPAE